MNEVKGTDKCFMCDTTLDWEYIPSPRNGQIITYMVPDVKADVVCICPRCGVKNKYIKTI